MRADAAGEKDGPMNAHGPPRPPAAPRLGCPDCGAALTARSPNCLRCGLPLVGDTAQRLWRIDTELARLDERRRALRDERATVVELLRGRPVPPVGDQRPSAPAPSAGHAPYALPEAGAVPGAADRAPSSAGRTDTPPRRHSAPAPGEVARRSAQNLILGLGGVLVGIAALVFAIWAWSDMGTGARAAVLGLTTATFAALALPLHRRGLKATAETFGCLAAALLCVDALALWLLASDRLGDGPGYTAAALLGIAALTALHPLLVPLRAPRVVAVLLCQPVPVLLGTTLPPSSGTWLLPALAATALADLLLARRLGRPRPGVPVRTLHACAVLTWALSLLLAAPLLVLIPLLTGPGLGYPVEDWWLPALTLLPSGAVGLLLARRLPPAGSPGTGAVPDGGHAAGSASLWTALLALGAAPLAAGPAHLLAPLPPHAPWSAPATALWGSAASALGAAAPATTSDAALGAAGTLVTGAAAVALVGLLHRRHTAVAVALAAPPVLVPLPLLLGASLFTELVWTFAIGSALSLWSALTRDPRTGWSSGLVGLLTLLLCLYWALAQEHASAGVLMALAVVGAVLAALARTSVAAVGATAAATAATGAFALALPLLLGAPAEYAALAPIAMVSAVAAAAPGLRGRLAAAAEVPACAWALLSLGVAVAAGARAELVALALAVVGVIALATAVRPHRRWFALPGALLMLAALWTVLTTWDVSVPEAYTAPPALAALAVGWEWSRKAPQPPSSWAAYAGGLALLLLPTVALVLTEDGTAWRVPAVLAVGLAVTAWGLRRRLQAALVLGGLALVATSLRAFGAPLWELGRLLPNWVPFALAGLLLLGIGARYEANLERVRRLGRWMAAMR